MLVFGQLPDFLFCQGSVFSWRKGGVKLQAAHGNSFQIQHFFAFRFEHPFYLMETSLGDGEFNFRFRTGGENPQVSRERGLWISDIHAFPKRGSVLFGDGAVDSRIVGFGNMFSGSQKIMRKRTVIGDQKQPFRILI